MRPELRPSELEELAGCLGQAGGRLRAEFAAGVGREDLRLALEAENIEARPVWKPMHLQPVLRRNSRAFELTPVRSRKDAEPRIFYNSSMS